MKFFVKSFSERIAESLLYEMILEDGHVFDTIRLALRHCNGEKERVRESERVLSHARKTIELCIQNGNAQYSKDLRRMKSLMRQDLFCNKFATMLSFSFF